MSGTARPTVLLLGAGGQLGRELSRSLNGVGRLTCTARKVTDVEAAAGWRSLDVTDFAKVHAAVREVRPEIIVNATAYTAVDRAESDSAAAWTVNAEAPAVLAEEAQQVGAALVHFSTDYVFSGRGERAWAEDDLTEPLNIYGQSKLAGEEAIRESGANHLIVRTSWLYGRHGHNFVKTMLLLGAEREELRVVADQIGAPTSAAMVADFTTQILDKPAWRAGSVNDRNSHSLLHLCCSGETSWHGFAEEIFRLVQQAGFPLAVRRVLPITSNEYPTPAARPHNSRLDCRRLREQFGLVPPDWKAELASEFAAICAAI